MTTVVLLLNCYQKHFIALILFLTQFLSLIPIALEEINFCSQFKTIKNIKTLKEL